MKQIKLDPNQEKSILIGIIVSDVVIRNLRSSYKPEYINSDYIKTVCNWCFKYYDDYGRAPKKHIKDIYKREKRKHNLDEDISDNIAKVLRLASKEFKHSKKFNADFAVDQAIEYFKKRSLEEFTEQIQGHILNNDVDSGIEVINKFSVVSLDEKNYGNPFNDKEAIFSAFTEKNEPIFKMKGALGKMINGDLCRESFIGIMGREKIGKTWRLMDFALTAARQRCNVAFFQAGDMTQKQQIRRMHIAINKRSDKKKYCGNVFIPVIDCFNNQIDDCKIKYRKNDESLIDYLDGVKSSASKEDVLEALSDRDNLKYVYKRCADIYEPCSVCLKKKKFRRHFKGSVWYEKKNIKPLHWKDAYKRGVKFSKMMRRKQFILSSHSNNTLTVRKIISLLDTWNKEFNFVPDVIFVDYPDIMAPDNQRLEFRHQENDKWKRLRALAQDYRCLVIVATQANAGSYETDRLEPKNFSEDKRKYSHVTSMLALNQSILEKKLGIIRIGQLFVRDDDFSIDRQIHVLQSLQTGQPYITSY